MRCLRPPRLALLLLLLLVIGGQGLLAEDYGEVVEVNVVTVDVEVRDAQGRQVTDLERRDFQILEDGARMELTNFERVVQPARAVAATAEPSTAPAVTATSPAATPSPAPPEAESRIVVYVDNMHLHAASRARALRQVRDHLAGGLAVGERIMVVSQDAGGLDVRLPFSTDAAAVSGALDAVDKLAAHAQEDDHTRSTAVQAVIALQKDDIDEETPCAPDIAQPVRAYAESTRRDVLHTLDRIGFLVNSLAGLPGRKALLYVSDGIPQQPGQDLFQVLYNLCGGGSATGGPWMPQELQGFDASVIGPGAYRAQSAALDAAGYETTNDLRRLAAHASANRVSVYTLQASGLATAFTDSSAGPEDLLLQDPSVAAVAAENPKGALVYLANQTGGRAIVDTNDFGRELGRMREDLATYYSLGYTPKHQGDGKEHAVEVRVRRPGVKLVYRRNYRDKPALEQTADRMLAALMHGYEDNPLGITVEVLPAKSLENGHFLVTARLLVPLFKLATVAHDDAFEGKLRVMVITGGPGTGTSGIRQVEVPLRVPRMQALTAFGQSYAYELGLELTSGDHDVAFAVRDELGATTSYLRRTLAVAAPAPAGGR